MSDSSVVPHGWSSYLWTALVAILASGGTYLAATLPSIFNRNKTRAETRSLDIKTSIETGDAILELIKEVVQMKADAQQVSGRADHWQRKAEAQEYRINEMEMRIASQEIEITHYEKQQKKMKGMLDVHGIKYSEGDTPKEVNEQTRSPMEGCD